MKREYFPFIDWMKCLGIVLIVHGHVSNQPIVPVPPVYEKQLGVVFFMFVMGFSLAREERHPWRVVYNRLFEVYLFGLSLAMLLSALGYVADGNLLKSNYGPFAAGLNVLFNFFPANPTTWFVGTYLHALVLWAIVLKPIRVSRRLLVASAAFEIVVRATLMAKVGGFVAYMLLPNWTTVFLMGIRAGQQEVAPPHRPMTALIGIAGAILLWPMCVAQLSTADGFPFMRFVIGSTPVSLVATSATISAVYLGYGWLTFALTRSLPSAGAVRFMARNTLIVFLAHMPVFYWLNIRLRGVVPSYSLRVTIQMLVCLVLLAWLSEAVCRVVAPHELRERAAAWISRRRRTVATAAALAGGN